MVDSSRLPGFSTPAATDPGPRHPGPALPDPSTLGAVVVSVAGAAIDSTGTTTVGTPDGFGGEVVVVRVNATATDFSFNVNADGTPLFGSAQSPSSTDEESFAVPAGDFDGDAPDLVFEVTSASASGGATADVDIDTAVAER